VRTISNKSRNIVQVVFSKIVSRSIFVISVVF